MRPDYPYALPFERYLQTLGEDFARLRALADRARYEPVPDCPGWRGEDVLRHLAEVYLHKVEAIRLQQLPRPWPPEHLGGVETLELLDTAHAALVAELTAHDPADPAWTWWPADQSVGFWARRMAHETSVHRHDVERAVGEPTPVAPDLAVDGIDEVLALMLATEWTDDLAGGGPPGGPAGRGGVVAIASGGHDWSVGVAPGRVEVARHEPADPVARVSGDPSAVLLWLWGRGPVPHREGDAAAVTALRDRLALATR